MYHHIKKLMHTVNVGSPDPRFGNMLLERVEGRSGETIAKNHKPVGDETGKTRVKKSA